MGEFSHQGMSSEREGYQEKKPSENPWQWLGKTGMDFDDGLGADCQVKVINHHKNGSTLTKASKAEVIR